MWAGDIDFKLGVGQVIKGWDKVHMQVKMCATREQRARTLSAKLAWPVYAHQRCSFQNLVSRPLHRCFLKHVHAVCAGHCGYEGWRKEAPCDSSE